MAVIPDEAKHLFEGKDFAHVATVNEDGSPQVSAIWIALDGDQVTFNTAEGRVKTNNLHRDPRVAISIHNQGNPYENLIIQGRAAEVTQTAPTPTSTRSPSAISAPTPIPTASRAKNG